MATYNAKILVSLEVTTPGPNPRDEQAKTELANAIGRLEAKSPQACSVRLTGSEMISLTRADLELPR